MTEAESQPNFLSGGELAGGEGPTLPARGLSRLIARFRYQSARRGYAAARAAEAELEFMAVNAFPAMPQELHEEAEIRDTSLSPKTPDLLSSFAIVAVVQEDVTRDAEARAFRQGTLAGRSREQIRRDLARSAARRSLSLG